MQPAPINSQPACRIDFWYCITGACISTTMHRLLITRRKARSRDRTFSDLIVSFHFIFFLTLHLLCLSDNVLLLCAICTLRCHHSCKDYKWIFLKPGNKRTAMENKQVMYLDRGPAPMYTRKLGRDRIRGFQKATDKR